MKGTGMIVSRCCATACLLAWAIANPSYASEPPLPSDRPLRDSYLTNGPATRRAFADVVSDANRWTVRVRSDEHETAFGVVIRADGYVLTKGSRLNGHLECVIPDYGILPATYVSYHPAHDLALLKVAASDLPVVRWQEEDDPSVGRWAITPDGQSAPRSVGVISVSRRDIPEIRIPGVLGVRLDPQKQPATVLDVMPESAAERAGVRTGDVITRVNDQAITTSGTLIVEIGKHRPQDSVTLVISRDGESRTVQATLTHPFGEFLTRIAQQNEMGGKLSERRSGFPVVLQHDSVLGPEECGGPLVDLSGAAIGVNIARAGRTETYAIPDDIVRVAIDELLSGKYPPPQTHLAETPVDKPEVETSTSGGQ